MQPLLYLQTVYGLVWTIACVPLGFLLTALGYFIINKVPAEWLCDYNETPSEEMLNGQRVSYKKTGIFVSVLMSALLIMTRLQFNKNFDLYFLLVMFVVFDCAMIVVADIKYQIIPDQFTIALGVTAVIVSVYDLVRGYHILHSAWWSPIAGAFMGAAAMIIIDLIGQLVYKKEGMGFGDVKLFAAAGILTGFPGTIYAFIVSIVIATICFTAIILISRIALAKSSESTEQSETQEEIQPDGQETAEQKAELQEEPEESEGKTFGTYLAFGPYIVLAVALYISLFDQIQYIVRIYLNLF